jgi:hypothetical protein
VDEYFGSSALQRFSISRCSGSLSGKRDSDSIAKSSSECGWSQLTGVLTSPRKHVPTRSDCSVPVISPFLGHKLYAQTAAHTTQITSPAMARPRPGSLPPRVLIRATIPDSRLSGMRLTKPSKKVAIAHLLTGRSVTAGSGAGGDVMVMATVTLR